MSVSHRFEKAAASYESATPIQRETAEALAARIAGAGLPPRPRVAEFGCGTGYLPEAAWEALDPGLWIATDIAPSMAAITAASLPEEGLAAVMDAGRPALAPGFDLVCSSLTLQWLAEPQAVVGRWRALVKPGGVLAVATLVEGSFGEWRAALAKVGAAPPGPIFPTLDALKGWFGPEAEIGRLTLTDRHDSGLGFVRAARAAGIDWGSGRPLGAGVMRRAMKAFEAGGGAATYEVAVVVERVEP